jgi:hypothetical protein
MPPPLLPFALGAGASFVLILVLAGTLHLLQWLGRPGRALANACTKAPLLDLIVATMTWVPWVASALVWEWKGAIGCIVGQMVAMGIWCLAHEAAHPGVRKGPRIVSTLNRLVGRVRNHAALWATLIAVPAFWSIRLGQITAYPLLVWIVDFPRYRQSEWINVSRQKFSGLVGHDLIWCLYCDWMTGVYSLGAEMLRNVESFWCPIRFYDGKKCENCKVDFPDIDGGWVSSAASMGDVTKKLEEQYANGRREWFGHPARLTIEGKERASPARKNE